MQACAPGKLILSGEHSAVYGAPAVALAVNRYIHCQSEHSSFPGLIWSLPEQQLAGRLTWQALSSLRQQLDQYFVEFEQGFRSVAEILSSPEQLLLYAVAQLLPSPLPSQGFSIQVNSQLPLGAGMGSSAAAAASILALSAAEFGVTLDLEQRFRLVRYCERLCHGRGGLIDSAAVTHGGLIQVLDGEVSPLPHNLEDGWFYVNSGTPQAGTGECVEFVRQRFANEPIWQKFTNVTHGLVNALAEKRSPVEFIRENHRLLQHIGVVPQPVSDFIAQLELLGAAAKVSGAGSVHGDNAGALIVYAPDIDVSVLCEQAGYDFMSIEQDRQGARVCD